MFDRLHQIVLGLDGSEVLRRFLRREGLLLLLIFSKESLSNDIRFLLDHVEILAHALIFGTARCLSLTEAVTLHSRNLAGRGHILSLAECTVYTSLTHAVSSAR